MGLLLPQPMRARAGLRLPYEADGSLAAPLGKVGVDVTPEQGYRSARLRVFAMVNVAPRFDQTPRVTNGYSDLILERYGEAGSLCRLIQVH